MLVRVIILIIFPQIAPLLPLNGARWLGRNIVNDPVHPLDAVDDPVGDSAHDLIGDL